MSTIAESPTAPRPRNHFALRSFLAGGTATTALIAGAVILFASLATYVAFNQLGGGGEAADSTATVPTGGPSGAPEAAASGAGGAPAAVAAAAAEPTAVAPAPVAAPPQLLAEVPPDSTPPGTRDSLNTVKPPASPDGTPAQQSGALGGTVSGLENATGDLGLSTPLGELTDPITRPIDDTLNDTLNHVGGLLGNPDLGDQVTHGLNQTTNALLGPGGLTDQLLGGNR